MAGEILTELNRIDGNIDAAFEKCRALGATMPSTINSDYLPATIETIPSASNIPVKTASDMTVSGATVTAPAGWYKSEASKSVATATQATPSISVSSGGLITASATQSAGYVDAGTKSGTKQLTTQAAKTVTPTKSEQTAVAAGVFTTGAIKVAKIPDSYIQPSGTKAIAENGTHDVTSFASVEVNVPTSGGGGGGGAVEAGTLTVSFTGNLAGFGEYIGAALYYNKKVSDTIDAESLKSYQDTTTITDVCLNTIVTIIIPDDVSLYGEVSTTKNCKTIESIYRSGMTVFVVSPTSSEATVTFS